MFVYFPQPNRYCANYFDITKLQVVNGDFSLVLADNTFILHGRFGTPTTASGTFRFTNFRTGCSYYSSGLVNWTASWISAATPAPGLPSGDKTGSRVPELQLSPAPYSDEPVNP